MICVLGSDKKQTVSYQAGDARRQISINQQEIAKWDGY